MTPYAPAVSLIRSFVVAIILSAFWLTGSAYAQEDIEPPKLLDLQFEPREIDTSTGPVTVTVSISVSDDLSGVSWVVLNFRKQGTTQNISIDIVPDTSWGKLIEGDNLNGRYSNTMTLPRYAAFGEWEMYYVTLIDNVGNRSDIWKPEVQQEAKQSEWPTLFNGFIFKVGIDQLPHQMFIPFSLK